MAFRMTSCGYISGPRVWTPSTTKSSFGLRRRGLDRPPQSLPRCNNPRPLHSHCRIGAIPLGLWPHFRELRLVIGPLHQPHRRRDGLRLAWPIRYSLQGTTLRRPDPAAFPNESNPGRSSARLATLRT
jgi:hypothetical protein